MLGVQTIGVSPFSKDDQKRYLERKLKLFNMDISKWDFDVSEEEDYLVLNVELETKKQIRKIANMITLRHFPFSILPLIKPDKRNYPMRIPCPINRKEIIQYEIPYIDSHQITLPENIEISSDFGHFSLNFEHIENQIIVTRLFQFNRGDYSLERYPAVYEFNKSIEAAIEKSIIVFNQK